MSDTIETYTAGHRLRIDAHWREPGELVPEAHTWFRRQDWVHTGYLVEATVSAKDFTAAVKKYCPKLADQIDVMVGIPDDIILQGPQKSPRRIKAK